MARRSDSVGQIANLPHFGLAWQLPHDDDPRCVSHGGRGRARLAGRRSVAAHLPCRGVRLEDVRRQTVRLPNRLAGRTQWILGLSTQLPFPGRHAGAAKQHRAGRILCPLQRTRGGAQASGGDLHPYSRRQYGVGTDDRCGARIARSAGDPLQASVLWRAGPARGAGSDGPRPEDVSLGHLAGDARRAADRGPAGLAAGNRRLSHRYHGDQPGRDHGSNGRRVPSPGYRARCSFSPAAI